MTLAADLEADFAAAQAAGRTTDPPMLCRNPDPQETGILLLAGIMRETFGESNGACGAPRRQCPTCHVAWTGDEPCWCCHPNV